MKLAQFRMLGRLLNGDVLPTHRYRQGTILNLWRRHWAATELNANINRSCVSVWRPTEAGRKAYLAIVSRQKPAAEVANSADFSTDFE